MKGKCRIMNNNKIQKMFSSALYVILGVVLAAAVILILPVYQKYRNMQIRVSRLEQEDRELLNEYQTLLTEVHDLDSDALAIERVAREKYKLCRENEQILIYK